MRDKQLNLKKMYDKVNHRGRMRLTEYRLRESDHEMSKLGRFITRESMDVIELREHEVLGQKTDTLVIFVVPVKDKVETQLLRIPFLGSILVLLVRKVYVIVGCGSVQLIVKYQPKKGRYETLRRFLNQWARLADQDSKIGLVLTIFGSKEQIAYTQTQLQKLAADFPSHFITYQPGAESI